MGTTSPDGIGYPDVGYTGGIRLAVKDTADTTQTALLARAGRTFRPADAAALTALSSSYTLQADDRAYQVDTGVIYRYSGSAWVPWESDWITWATAPTNITVGTGGSVSSLQRYKWVAGRVYFNYSFTLGSSGSSMGTQPTLNLPLAVAMRIPANNIAEGDAGAYDLSATTGHFCKQLIQTSTTVYIRHTYTGSATSTISSTAPFTWAAGDVLAGGFWGDPA